jgi:hypothetical protein
VTILGLRHRILAMISIALACLIADARASDMAISIEVKTPRQRVTSAATEEQPSSKKPATRPICSVRPNQEFVVSWKVSNTAKRNAFKDVMIHCVIVTEKQPGQITMPPLKDPVQESALTMDFKPGSTATGKFSLALDEPGAYLLRVESRNMVDSHGHDHYAALDLVCE